jgi:hypothetical protein
MASVTIFDSVRCSIVTWDDRIDVNEVMDKWSDAGMTLSMSGKDWEFEIWRHEDHAHLYATDDQMRSLRDWLNKRIKD